MNSGSLPCLQVLHLRIKPLTVLRLNCPELIWEPYGTLMSGFPPPTPRAATRSPVVMGWGVIEFQDIWMLSEVSYWSVW